MKKKERSAEESTSNGSNPSTKRKLDILEDASPSSKTDIVKMNVTEEDDAGSKKAPEEEFEDWRLESRR